MFFLNRFRIFLLSVALLGIYLYSRTGSVTSPRTRRAPVETKDGVTYPNSAVILARGSTYTVTYSSQYELSYVNVDLYSMEPTQMFTASVATNQAFGTQVTITIPSTVAPRSNYVVMVWGPLKSTGVAYNVPMSSSFAIVDPEAGLFSNPPLQGALYTGRQQTLNYTLGTVFDGVTTVRVELLNSEWPFSYIVQDQVPASGKTANYSLKWMVPASLKLSQLYSLRISAIDAATALAPGTYAPSLTASSWLISTAFSIFPVPAMDDPSFKVVADTHWISGQNASISWTYGGISTIGSINYEAYNVYSDNSYHLGTTIASQTFSTNPPRSGQLSFQVPDQWPSGVWFVRVFVYPANTTITDAIDPISGESTLVTLNDNSVNITDVPNELQIVVPGVWIYMTPLNITWTSNISRTISEYTVELFRLKTLYKIEGILGSTNLTTFQYSYTPQSNVTIGSDYAVRVTAHADGAQMIGSWASTAITVYATAADAAAAAKGSTQRVQMNGTVVGAISAGHGRYGDLSTSMMLTRCIVPLSVAASAFAWIM